MPPLLEVEDVVKAGRPDELSMITYLAQLYHRLEGEGVPSPVVRRTRRRTGGKRKGAIQSLMSSQTGRPVSWHGGDLSRLTSRPVVTPVERDNPFLHSVEELALTNITSNKPPVVQLRRLKKPKYSNYNSHHSQAKENSSPPSTSSSAARRRGRPASYIGISDSPRPWSPYYSRNGDQILASPSLLGEDWSDTRLTFTLIFSNEF